MTLVVAISTGNGVWMAGDRVAGGFNYTELGGPKIFRLTTGDGCAYGLGFAGSPRVAQTVVAVTPPDRDRDNRSLHWWLTTFCDRVHDRCRDLGAIAAHDDDGDRLAGSSDFLMAVDGHVVRIGEDFSWEHPARGWECVGGAAYVWVGAFEVLRDLHDDRTAARLAWPVAQRHHRVGDLVDEFEVPRG